MNCSSAIFECICICILFINVSICINFLLSKQTIILRFHSVPGKESGRKRNILKVMFQQQDQMNKDILLSDKTMLLSGILQFYCTSNKMAGIFP